MATLCSTRICPKCSFLLGLLLFLNGHSICPFLYSFRPTFLLFFRLVFENGPGATEQTQRRAECFFFFHFLYVPRHVERNGGHLVMSRRYVRQRNSHNRKTTTTTTKRVNIRQLIVQYWNLETIKSRWSSDKWMSKEKCSKGGAHAQKENILPSIPPHFAHRNQEKEF